MSNITQAVRNALTELTFYVNRGEISVGDWVLKSSLIWASIDPN